MDRLVAKVRKNIRSQGLIDPGDLILVAVSGGVDSMVLLDILRKLSSLDDFALHVAHFNHQLRETDADLDEKLVELYCLEHGLEFNAGRGDVTALAQGAKLSTEMAARELRLDFLGELARRLPCDGVATAHHADDQAELFFIRLFRGSGGDALGGMQPLGPFPSPKADWCKLIRPLLDIGKAALLKYAERFHIAYREDVTNSDTDILRNRIRRDLLPTIAGQFGEVIYPAIVRTMEVTRAEADLAAKEADTWLNSEEAGRCTFEGLHIAVQRHVVRRQLWGLGIEETFDLIESLRQEFGTVVQVSPGTFLSLRSDGQLEKTEPMDLSFLPGELEIQLDQGSGIVGFGDVTISWEIDKAEEEFSRPTPAANSEVFDAELVGGKVRLRHWRPGDRFRPLGMPEAVKLQDWFVNHKIPAERRRQLVLAEMGDGRIFWVEGQRIGEEFKLDKASRHRLKWQWQSTHCPR